MAANSITSNPAILSRLANTVGYPRTIVTFTPETGVTISDASQSVVNPQGIVDITVSMTLTSGLPDFNLHKVGTIPTIYAPNQDIAPSCYMVLDGCANFGAFYITTSGEISVQTLINTSTNPVWTLAHAVYMV